MESKFNSLKIIKSLTIKDYFKEYLSAVYKELSKNDKTISKYIFSKFVNLPIFLSDKLYNLLKENKLMTQSSFINGLETLYNGNVKDVIHLICDLLDFNKDEKIFNDDTILILKIIFNQSKKSFTFIEKLFNKKKYVTKDYFIEYQTNIDSKLFITIIKYIYSKALFNESNVEIFNYNTLNTLPTEDECENDDLIQLEDTDTGIHMYDMRLKFFSEVDNINNNTRIPRFTFVKTIGSSLYGTKLLSINNSVINNDFVFIVTINKGVTTFEKFWMILINLDLFLYNHENTLIHYYNLIDRFI